VPDLSRERRDRARQSLDQRIEFRSESGGTFNDFGEYVENVTEWTAWGRRDDANIDTAYELGVDGFREIGETRLITRYDSRIRVGTNTYFTVGGKRFRLTLVEEVGRNRYMRIAGVLTE